MIHLERPPRRPQAAIDIRRRGELVAFALWEDGHYLKPRYDMTREAYGLYLARHRVEIGNVALYDMQGDLAIELDGALFGWIRYPVIGGELARAWGNPL